MSQRAAEPLSRTLTVDDFSKSISPIPSRRAENLGGEACPLGNKAQGCAASAAKSVDRNGDLPQVRLRIRRAPVWRYIAVTVGKAALKDRRLGRNYEQACPVDVVRPGALALSSGGAYAAAAAAATTDTGAGSTVSEVSSRPKSAKRTSRPCRSRSPPSPASSGALEGINTIQDMTDLPLASPIPASSTDRSCAVLAATTNFYTIDSAVAIYYDDFFAQTTSSSAATTC